MTSTFCALLSSSREEALGTTLDSADQSADRKLFGCDEAIEKRQARDLVKVWSSRYCLSYTAVVLTFLPFESVTVVVTVRLRPSAETTTRPVSVTLPLFLAVNVKVRAFT